MGQTGLNANWAGHRFALSPPSVSEEVVAEAPSLTLRVTVVKPRIADYQPRDGLNCLSARLGGGLSRDRRKGGVRRHRQKIVLSLELSER